ncbi:glycosyltransferase [Vibrio alginolyticus]|uniref:glycosyltransferase n=1 Tax=Vibrio alginolyticus TaxID=663 RepID=UPI001EEC9595|nr:glycosyltransferase [Vibrio alginolyticus]MCG6307788.1 glycosyltransferase [Vibrio alginolyticus]
MNKQPLVSFIIIAYNQEKYIEEAIRGAFAQTYEPLEIILSDDNSPDKTFEIMQRLAEEYDGPHKVVLNRNEPNLGIGGHTNRVMELSQGEFIVVNAGDDISFPNRVRDTVNKWVDCGQIDCVISAQSIQIGENGNVLSIEPYESRSSLESLSSVENLATENGWLLGASLAFTKSLHDFFGPINKNVVAEDVILALRGAILGEILLLDAPLVYYRQVGIISGNKNSNSTNIWMRFITMTAFNNIQRLVDVEKARSEKLISSELSNLLNDTFNVDINRYKLCESIILGKSGKFKYLSLTITKLSGVKICKDIFRSIIVRFSKYRVTFQKMVRQR